MGSFDLNLLLHGQYHDWLISGLYTTVLLSLVAFVIALILGVIVASLRSVPFKPIQWLMFLYVEYHRNTPALVQLFFWYFAMPEVLPTPIRQWIYAHNAEFILAAIALGLAISAYISEDVRSGVRSVPKSQTEAAQTIGFSYGQTLAYIILPQAIRLCIPALVSRALLLVKNSSLAMTVGVAELVYQARHVESVTFRAYEAFTFATVCYLALTISIMFFGKRYEKLHRLVR